MSSEESKKHYVPFVGLLEDYVGRSPIDFYSWGHIALGIGSFTIFSLMITLYQYITEIPSTLEWYWIYIGVLIVAILWELFENIILWRLGLKYENRKDTFLNAFFDIIFVLVGGGVMWLFKLIIVDLMEERFRWFYVTALIAFLVILICYFIGYYITNENTKLARKERGKLIS
ncbi:MAG: hypothetical protein ACFE8L_07505 [Candidatus Hodarchaeota archaeon]